MTKRARRILVGAVVLGTGALGWAYASHMTWGHELVGASRVDRSGRASLCEAPVLVGDSHPTTTEELGQRTVSRGVERSYVYAFDGAGLMGGKVALCSEYGFVRLRGVDGTMGRVLVTVSNPYPGGARAVTDTNFNVDVRAVDRALYVSLWQTTQGLTAYRSLMSRGARPTRVNVELEVPRSGIYDVRLVANHGRVGIRDLDVYGGVQGYGSVGADIDARLAGPLSVHMRCTSYVTRFPEDWGHFDGRPGIIAHLMPLKSADLDARCDEGDVNVVVADDRAGLAITASAASRPPEIEVGPIEPARSDSGGARVETAGFSRALVQLKVVAVSAGGAVLVRRE